MDKGDHSIVAMEKDAVQTQNVMKDQPFDDDHLMMNQWNFNEYHIRTLTRAESAVTANVVTTEEAPNQAAIKSKVEKEQEGKHPQNLDKESARDDESTSIHVLSQNEEKSKLNSEQENDTKMPATEGKGHLSFFFSGIWLYGKEGDRSMESKPIS